MKSKQYKIKDPVHGEVFVSETKTSLVMTNAKPSTKGRWVKRGDSYTFELYSKKVIHNRE